jgi:hypothetical protein
MTAWVGVDLDGTLAEYDGWKGIEHIGQPKEWMRGYIQDLINRGVEVRVVTARVQEGYAALRYIEDWCLNVFGIRLQVTDCKDMDMVFLIDDRAYGPRTWHALPEPWEVEASTSWHNNPKNPNSPASVAQADGDSGND